MELITKYICRTSTLGLNNNLFGGELLSWFDMSGLMFCSDKCDAADLVTVSMNATFIAPVRVKNQVFIYGELTKIGKTSVSCRLTARKHDVETGKQKDVGSAELVFVRIDSEGDPRPFPDRIRKKNGFKPLNKEK